MKGFSGAIVERYDKLSGQDCCLSCGKALSFAPIRPGDTCVDLGSGQGHDALRMAIMTGPEGFVYGVDISDGMMETAKQNASKLKFDHVAFIKCPLEEINLNTEQVDVLISNCTINHSLNQAGVWKEIARILKPGACFVVSDIYAIETIPEEYANDPVSVSECWAGAVTKDKYIEHMITAGLTGLEILEESLPYDKGKVQVASFTVRGIKPKTE